MNTRRRTAQRTLLAMVVLLALTAGCGGGGSVSGPSGSTGSSTGVVQGQVVSSRTAARGEPIVVVVLRSALGVGVAEAQAGSPVPGATVRLTGGGTVRTTTTDSNGQFVFRDVAAGPYTLEVLDATGAVVSTVAFAVGADDQAIVGVVTNGTSTVQITAISTDVFNNDAQLGHAVNIANASSSCDLVQVTRLREQGLGWGDIAHRCNVSPSVIGLGRSNLSDTELDDARERTGHGRKHGGGSGTSGGNGKGRGNGKKA